MLRLIFRAPFSTVRLGLTVGSGIAARLLDLVLGVSSLSTVAASATPRTALEAVDEEELGAIVFTTGATGPPKGVPYTHRILAEQTRLLKETWGIEPDDVGLAAFVPFSLFCIAMGTCCVLPSIDPRRPADVDADHVLALARRFRFTYSFGSPAFWAAAADRLVAAGERLPDLTRLILFGAPIRADLVMTLKACLPANGEVFTPYGATEALPLTSISGREILETAAATRAGAGVCVGTPIPGGELRILAVSDQPISGFAAARLLAAGEVGEIVVSGPTVTSRYETQRELTARAKIFDGEKVWHRMGDAGYLDSMGRVWFCGRVNHRVVCDAGVLYSVCCEAVFNQHSSIARSALVGVTHRGRVKPVVCLELRPDAAHAVSESAELRGRLFSELRGLAEAQPHTKTLTEFLIHPGFPVDFRHNAKIIREELAIWAASPGRNTA